MYTNHERWSKGPIRNPIHFEFWERRDFYLGSHKKFTCKMASRDSPGIETVCWSLIGVGPTCGVKDIHRIERMRRVTRPQ
jgi:hypothetical protein